MFLRLEDSFDQTLLVEHDSCTPSPTEAVTMPELFSSSSRHPSAPEGALFCGIAPASIGERHELKIHLAATEELGDSFQSKC